MQTPSHFLLTAVLARKAPSLTQTGSKISLLAGSILPDLPLVLLTLGYELYYRWFAVSPTSGSVMEYLHFDLFFTDPVWIISHNFFHSLVINFVLLTIGYWGMRREQRWARLLFWLTVGTLFHSVIDILTHNSDGPLLFFPLNWRYRFPSPVSYWEAAYYGREFRIFEYAVDALIIIYLITVWRKQIRQNAAVRS
ncbi:MAG: metal-dependent hydrolase [Anaerolineaceae bacterium]|nr:metal-dependent hydrolase [Anaerolineaceae bacterium]